MILVAGCWAGKDEPPGGIMCPAVLVGIELESNTDKFHYEKKLQTLTDLTAN